MQSVNMCTYWKDVFWSNGLLEVALKVKTSSRLIVIFKVYLHLSFKRSTTLCLSEVELNLKTQMEMFKVKVINFMYGCN